MNTKFQSIRRLRCKPALRNATGRIPVGDRCRSAGVTLIELVVAMVLVGLLIMSFLMSVVPVAEGMLIVERNTEASQKAQLAVTRLIRELTATTNVVAGTTTTMVFDMVDVAGTGQRRTLSWSAGGPLTLNGIPLSDDVALFALRYRATPAGAAQNVWSPALPLVEFVLQSASTGGIVYTNRVFLRN